MNEADRSAPTSPSRPSPSTVRPSLTEPPARPLTDPSTDLSTDPSIGFFSSAGTGSGVTAVPDEVLARRAGLGDKTAFAHLVTRHGPGLYRYVFRLLHDPGDAEDCVQEVMTSAWKNIGSYRGQASVKTWLLVMGRHEAQKISQRRRPRFPQSGSRPVIDFDEATRDVADLHANTEGESINTQLLVALDAALLVLPERQRSVWILREVEDLSYNDIAAVLGITPTAVRGLLERARSAIAQSLKEWR